MNKDFKVAILTTSTGIFAIQQLVKELNISLIIIDSGKRSNTKNANHNLISRSVSIIKNDGIGAFAKNLHRKIFHGGKPYAEALFDSAREKEISNLNSLDNRFFGNTFFRNNPCYRNFLNWKEIEEYYDIPVKHVENINDCNSESLLKKSCCDLAVIAGGRIIRDNIIKIPRLGIINKHSSILPKHRGLAAEFWCLFHEDFEHLGVTVHFITPELDNGDIIIQKKIEFKKGDTAHSLRIKSDLIGAEAIIEAVDLIASGKSDFVKQDESKATSNTKPTPEEVKVVKNKLQHLWNKYGK